MDQATQKMARDCYGYGRWNAPFWFIGPEQGQGRWEMDVLTRHQAFVELNDDGLCDCREFHKRISEPRFHRETPALQSTWRRLMLVLTAYRGTLTGEKVKDKKTLCDYQRDQWGASTDRCEGLKAETCVIELSGLPANNFSVERDRDAFRQERIEKILEKMRLKEPGFVVIYSKSQSKYWKEIADFELKSIRFAPSPTAHGYTDQYWINIGKELRAAGNLS
jgi:hypothetical protein